MGLPGVTENQAVSSQNIVQRHQQQLAERDAAYREKVAELERLRDDVAQLLDLADPPDLASPRMDNIETRRLIYRLWEQVRI